LRSKKLFSADKPTFVVFMALLLVSVVVPTPAQARKFKVMHTFHGGDGANPTGVLIRDAAGNLYGTTGVGGSGNCSGGEGCGTVFKMDKNGKEVWVHKFNGANGANPYTGLLRDASGTLFGTTVFGGDTRCNPPYGCGTIFKLDKTGKKETVLHKFNGFPDGEFPQSLLVQDGAGNLYGVDSAGGTHSLGGVFKVSKTGKEKVLYSFTGGSDGCFPYPGVIRDSAGNLYGVTLQGGDGFCNNGVGVVFKVDGSGNETVLHTFGGGSNGANPDSVLIFDSQGNLVGTTQNGGSSACGGTGCGTVFRVSLGGDETVLYAFCSLSGCADGDRPLFGPLARDSKGNLYGTTIFGGTSACNGGGCGTIFKLDPSGKETVLHSFTGGSDGAFPYAGLTFDASGNLYGTAGFGGAKCYGSNTCGVVFKLTP
jgi:uncharacterized repeat protein (TIGR03803 family)